MTTAAILAFATVVQSSAGFTAADVSLLLTMAYQMPDCMEHWCSVEITVKEADGVVGARWWTRDVPGPMVISDGITIWQTGKTE